MRAMIDRPVHPGAIRMTDEGDNVSTHTFQPLKATVVRIHLFQDCKLWLTNWSRLDSNEAGGKNGNDGELHCCCLD